MDGSPKHFNERSVVDSRLYVAHFLTRPKLTHSLWRSYQPLGSGQSWLDPLEYPRILIRSTKVKPFFFNIGTHRNPNSTKPSCHMLLTSIKHSTSNCGTSKPPRRNFQIHQQTRPHEVGTSPLNPIISTSKLNQMSIILQELHTNQNPQSNVWLRILTGSRIL